MSDGKNKATTSRREVIKKIGLGGATFLGGATATTGAAALESDWTSGTVVVTSDSGEWDYQITMADPHNNKPPIQKGDNTESDDNISGPDSSGEDKLKNWATGTIKEVDSDEYHFPDTVMSIIVSLKGTSRGVIFKQNSGAGGGNVKVTGSDPCGMDYEFTVAGDIIEPHYFIEDNDNVWGNQVYGHMEDGGEDRYGALGYIHEVEVSDPQTNMSGGIQVTFDPDN